MLDFIRAYYRNKIKFELFILYGNRFGEVHKKANLKAQHLEYPITAEEQGISAKIDEYKGYINGRPKVIYNSSYRTRLHRYQNLEYSKVEKSIQILKKHMVDVHSSKLSMLNIGFSVPTPIKGREIVRLNVLMHNYNGYNHDLIPESKKELKQFVYHNYTIGVYADKHNEGKDNFIKIDLRFKKSIEFKKAGIININDLTNKEKLRGLFLIFINRFDELTIIDSIESYEQFEGKDKELMLKFMDVNFWEKLPRKDSRQTLSRKKKQFEWLQQKYNLNTLKQFLRDSIIEAFNHIIDN